MGKGGKPSTGEQGVAQRLHRTVDVPQANKLTNVRELVEAVRNNIDNLPALRELLGVDERHFAYYRRAAVILGVLSESDDGLVITDRGRSLLATKATILPTTLPAWLRATTPRQSRAVWNGWARLIQAS